jgi:hypothetical protein
MVANIEDRKDAVAVVWEGGRACAYKGESGSEAIYMVRLDPKSQATRLKKNYFVTSITGLSALMDIASKSLLPDVGKCT